MSLLDASCTRGAARRDLRMMGVLCCALCCCLMQACRDPGNEAMLGYTSSPVRLVLGMRRGAPPEVTLKLDRIQQHIRTFDITDPTVRTSRDGKAILVVGAIYSSRVREGRQGAWLWPDWREPDNFLAFPRVTWARFKGTRAVIMGYGGEYDATPVRLVVIKNEGVGEIMLPVGHHIVAASDDGKAVASWIARKTLLLQRIEGAGETLRLCDTEAAPIEIGAPFSTDWVHGDRYLMLSQYDRLVVLDASGRTIARLDGSVLLKLNDDHLVMAIGRDQVICRVDEPWRLEILPKWRRPYVSEFWPVAPSPSGALLSVRQPRVLVGLLSLHPLTRTVLIRTPLADESIQLPRHDFGRWRTCAGWISWAEGLDTSSDIASPDETQEEANAAEGGMEGG
ncbi:MAG: hypothetical protein KAS72_14050 [Phycisphaerales bacterium]|nr:hypothetical protein [Phycisphaerales bacterium]